jgi:hypothetical protein
MGPGMSCSDGCQAGCHSTGFFLRGSLAAMGERGGGRFTYLIIGVKPSLQAP